MAPNPAEHILQLQKKPTSQHPEVLCRILPLFTCEATGEECPHRGREDLKCHTAPHRRKQTNPMALGKEYFSSESLRNLMPVCWWRFPFETPAHEDDRREPFVAKLPQFKS
jgi:hypothetical protein